MQNCPNCNIIIEENKTNCRIAALYFLKIKTIRYLILVRCLELQLRFLKHKYKDKYQVLFNARFKCAICGKWATIVREQKPNLYIAVCFQHNKELRRASFAMVLNNWLVEQQITTFEHKYPELIKYNQKLKMWEDI